MITNNYTIRILIVMLIISLLCLAACSTRSEDKFGNPRLEDKAIYIFDSTGRCLRIELGIETSGGQFAQSGKIDVFLVKDKNSCKSQSELLK